MLCWQLVRCLPIKALLQLLSSPSPRSQFSEFRRRRLCGESSIYFARFLFLFCFVFFTIFMHFVVLVLIAFFYLQACRRRNQSRQLFFRRTGMTPQSRLIMTVRVKMTLTTICSSISAHLQCQLFKISSISTSIYVLLLAYVLNIIDSHIETKIVVGLWCLEALLKYIELDAAVVALKIAITSVGPNHQFRRHNRRI